MHPQNHVGSFRSSEVCRGDLEKPEKTEDFRAGSAEPDQRDGPEAGSSAHPSGLGV